jgi:flavin-dependent dehydrogenase
MLVGDAAGMVSPVTGGGIHTALHFGRRAAVLVANYLGDRGPAPARALAAEAPRYRAKLWLRRALDLAPPNALINCRADDRADAPAGAAALFPFAWRKRGILRSLVTRL